MQTWGNQGRLDNTEKRIRGQEKLIRELFGLLHRLGSGGAVNVGNAGGTLPLGSGGTGVVTGPVSVQSLFLNNSGGALAEGALVVMEGSRNVNTSTTAGDRLALGIVHGVGAPYAAGADTPILVLGYHASMLVVGAVAFADYLIASTTAGRAASTGAAPTEGNIAIALSATAGPGNGTVEAFVFGIDPGGSAGSGLSYLSFGDEPISGQSFSP